MCLQQLLDIALTEKIIQLAGEGSPFCHYDNDRMLAREYYTIRLNLGRRQGHSTAIIRNAKSDDIVFLRNSREVDNFSRLRPDVFSCVRSTVQNCMANWYHAIRDKPVIRVIWVDVASEMTKEQEHVIYDAICYTRRDVELPLFVFLG